MDWAEGCNSQSPGGLRQQQYRDGAAVTQSLFFSKMSPTSQSTKRRIVAKPSRNFQSYNSSVEPASIMSQPNLGMVGTPARPTGKKLSESRTVVNR